MKRTLMFLGIVVLCPLLALCGSGGGQPPQITFLSTAREWVPTPGDEVTYKCDVNNGVHSLTFDLESISGGAMLDVAAGKTVFYALGWPRYYCLQDYNSGSGSFSFNAYFSDTHTTCYDTDRFYDLVFGKLRPAQPRKDLAVLRESGTYIYYNTGSGMATSPNQTLSGAAIDATWGPFNYQDDSHDLFVTDGSQIRIYNNLNDGTLSTAPMVLSIPAQQILLAQMDENIYLTSPTTKWDLVSFAGTTLSIRLNDGNNGFNAPQDISMGALNYPVSVAVGDINNDGYNDIVVGVSTPPSQEVRLYLNNAGVIGTTPTWTYSGTGVPSNPEVLIGDLGNTLDANSNDGWNDLVVIGYEAPIKVFANQGSSPYFTSQPQQSIAPSGSFAPTGKVMLADVQNTGGLSLLYTQFTSHPGDLGTAYIWLHKHVGDPAPAPPKNIQISSVSQGEYTYPKVTWAPNLERDLDGYEIWRRITGICGDGNWYLLSSTIGASTHEYIDYSIGTVGYGSDCTAQYKLKAKDAALHYSDFSASVQIAFSSLWFKVAAGNREIIPATYGLHEAYPNPFNPATQISFDLPVDGIVSLAVFDVLGRKVADLVNEYRQAGYHTAMWDASKTASGVYFVRFTATNEL